VYSASKLPLPVPLNSASLTRPVDGYTSNVVGSSNGALVMNHNQTGYVANSPSPGYGGAYYTR